MIEFTMESIRRIYNDVCGDYIEIGHDADGLDTLEIRVVDDSIKDSSKRVMARVGINDKQQLKLFIQALREVGSFIFKEQM